MKTESGNFISVDIVGLKKLFNPPDFSPEPTSLQEAAGSPGRAEIAAQLIAMAQKEGRWVGVEYHVLADGIEHERAAAATWARAKAWPEPRTGGAKIPDELLAMRDEGLLRVLTFGGKYNFTSQDGKRKQLEDVEVVLPTEKLLQRIHEAQHRTAGTGRQRAIA